MTGTDPDDRVALIDRYGDRVPDVVDALNVLGFHTNDQQCLVNRSMGPVFRDDKRMSHAGVGIAFTARYRPPREEPTAVRSDVEKRPEMWYDNLSPVPYLDDIDQGDDVVAEVVNKSDVCLFGSRITLEYAAEDATGTVTNAGCRDIGEGRRTGRSSPRRLRFPRAGSAGAGGHGDSCQRWWSERPPRRRGGRRRQRGRRGPDRARRGGARHRRGGGRRGRTNPRELFERVGLDAGEME